MRHPPLDRRRAGVDRHAVENLGGSRVPGAAILSLEGVRAPEFLDHSTNYAQRITRAGCHWSYSTSALRYRTKHWSSTISGTPRSELDELCAAHNPRDEAAKRTVILFRRISPHPVNMGDMERTGLAAKVHFPRNPTRRICETNPALAAQVVRSGARGRARPVIPRPHRSTG